MGAGGDDALLLALATRDDGMGGDEEHAYAGRLLGDSAVQSP